MASVGRRVHQLDDASVAIRDQVSYGIGSRGHLLKPLHHETSNSAILEVYLSAGNLDITEKSANPREAITTGLCALQSHSALHTHALQRGQDERDLTSDSTTLTDQFNKKLVRTRLKKAQNRLLKV